MVGEANTAIFSPWPNQTRDVSGVEDYDHELGVGTIFLDILAQLLSGLGVAGQQVLASHALLAGSTTRGDDILGTGESLGGIGGGNDISVVETTLAHLLGYTLCGEHVVEADVGSQLQHQGCLNHVGTNHACGSNDNQFVIR